MSAAQYFRLYAAEETALLADFPVLHWSHCLCLPAYNETTDFLASLITAAKAAPRVLLILVINQPENSAECPANPALYDFFAQLPLLWQQQHLSLHRHETLDILLIDRFSHKRIPVKNGVGMARKIAADIACFLQYKQHIQSPWFYASDADVTFPPDYFQTRLPEHHSAAVFPFRHMACGDTAIDKATAFYEQSLHDYVNGLKQAASPYAFYTIGSCLMIEIDSYIKVRGFPQKSGAEDFYLLNKLQKIKPVYSLSKPVLFIQSRDSARVPFGTGPAVKKLMNSEHDALDFYWPPAIFNSLAQWLDYLNRLAEAGEYQTAASPLLQNLAQQYQLAQAVDAIFRQHKTASKRREHLHHWFDAFKTVKLLRKLKSEIA